MTDESELNQILSDAKREDLRILHFAALLRRESNLGPDDLVVVGGSAIEVYTEGAYVTGGIDICAPGAPVTSVLKRWGFQRTGQEWARLDWRIVVDIVAPLPSGSMRLTRVIDTPYGPVRIGGVEDLILGRLAMLKFWNEAGEVANLRRLAVLPDVDWDYLEDMARRSDVDDRLAQLRHDLRAALRPTSR